MSWGIRSDSAREQNVYIVNKNKFQDQIENTYYVFLLADMIVKVYSER